MKAKNYIKEIIEKLPHVRSLKRKLLNYQQSLIFPPGHFYSPVVDIQELIANRSKIFDNSKELHGIDLNLKEQQLLLESFEKYYSLLPFTDKANTTTRYYYDNEAYLWSDGIFLFLMISHFKPKKIIEIGSGFSSALMLDVNEMYFNNGIDLTFIEPFPDILKSIARDNDPFTLIPQKVQNVETGLFESLEENDILFIDSTHVAKTNSDVLFEIFEILPRLKKGVKIHIHDIFFPFEYPEAWVIDQKRNWNEIYFMRSFLMYNTHFKILCFNTYLEEKFTSWFEEHMPLCLKNRGGSLWIEKVQ